MNVGFHAEALEEYVAALVWYERDYPGRGARFRDAVELAIARITREPLAFPKRLGAHAVVVTRFPYLLFFELLDATTIRVLAIAHAKRRPGYWRERR